MKRTITYITGVLFTCMLLFAPSCKKRLIEYNPGGATADNVFNTPAGFESGVNAAYSYNRWLWGKEAGYHLLEASSDLWMSGVDDPNTEITQFTTGLNPANPVISAIWPRMYSAVNLCNALIKRVGNSSLPAATQRIREAELRMLRAWYYYTIVETWDGVHFTLDETQGIVTTANRTPVDSFYNQILADLRAAAPNLPNTTTDNGRVTRPAAEAFLAKVFLVKGMYDSSYFYANRVMTAYGLQLQPKYADLWLMSNNVNKEVIWAVNYSTNLTLNDFTGPAGAIIYPGGHPRGANNGHLHFLQKYDVRPGMERTIAYGRPFSRYMPTRFLLDLYDTKDSRYDASFQEVWFSNRATSTTYTRTLTTGGTASFTLNPGDTAHWVTRQTVTNAFRDSRKYEIFDRTNTYNANGTPRNTSNFVSLKKFLDPTRPSIAEQQSARDAWIFRLADIILIAAEAKHKAGDNGTAASLINLVRRRAVITGQPVNSLDITAADVNIDFILDERARELAGEQWRWFDLKRTGKLVERVRANNPQAGANIKEHHVLRPIPQLQMDAVTNKTEFTQNPGY
ncbi:MAG TPA: RagB/SusD family nutrient uptake outer membrane protein [Chitinophagaceae bacterium]|nr:RagB/SusD family nutrient uptake outer membrane protein [Chitinophagaceae bacterium]